MGNSSHSGLHAKTLRSTKFSKLQQPNGQLSPEGGVANPCFSLKASKCPLLALPESPKARREEAWCSGRDLAGQTPLSPNTTSLTCGFGTRS